jgi:hypothetical protein
LSVTVVIDPQVTMSSGALVRDVISRFPHHSSGDNGAGMVSDRFHWIILQMSIALDGRLILVTKNSLRKLSVAELMDKIYFFDWK